MNTKIHHSRKYRLNEEFFNNWSSIMAYVLGFWFADGNMRHEKSYRITFTSSDKGLLQDIRYVMCSSHPIRQDKGIEVYRLILFSRHLYEKLQELGGLPRKSKTIQFPQVPISYLPDFIRGYFDGDGSVFKVRYLSTKDQKPRVELRSNFTSGSKVFLQDLMEVLYESIGVTKKRLGGYDGDNSWKLGYGTQDTHKLFRFLYYPGCPIALARKQKFPLEILAEER